MSDHVLGNLDGVEGCTLLDLVTDEPECQTVGVGDVLAETAGIDGILTCRVEGHRIFLGGGFVDDNEAFGLAECLAGLLNACLLYTSPSPRDS